MDGGAWWATVHGVKIFQAQLQQYINQELPDVQSGLKGQRNQRSICQHPLDLRKSKEIPEEHLLLLHYYAKDFDCVDHKTRIFLKRWEYQTTLPAS